MFVCLYADTNRTQGRQTSQLSKKKLDKLIPTSKLTNMIVALVTLDTLVELVLVYNF